MKTITADTETIIGNKARRVRFNDVRSYALANRESADKSEESCYRISKKHRRAPSPVWGNAMASVLTAHKQGPKPPAVRIENGEIVRYVSADGKISTIRITTKRYHNNAVIELIDGHFVDTLAAFEARN